MSVIEKKEQGLEPAQVDSGLISLVLLARFHGIPVEPEQIAHEFGLPGKLFAASDIMLAAKKYKLQVKQVKTSIDRLDRTPLPAIAISKSGHFFVLAQTDGDTFLIQDPSAARPLVLSEDELNELWSGELILVASRESMVGDLAKFDFTWFIPAVIKYRRLLGEILLVSLALNLFALVTPLFFQVVMDKVLVHRGLTTLDVIAIGLLVVSIFEVVLSALRTYVFAHTTSRIDVELGARIFRHLLALPMSYL